MGIENRGDRITNQPERITYNPFELHTQPYGEELKQTYNFDGLLTTYKPNEGETLYQFVYRMALRIVELRSSKTPLSLTDKEKIADYIADKTLVKVQN